jgi:SIR2-like domain
MVTPALPSPEDCPIPDEVKTAARMGRLAFFVGNGISRLYGIPSWEELCTRMLTALADEKVIDHNKVALLAKHSLKAKISIADHYFKSSDAGAKGLTYKKMLLKNLDDKATAYSSLAKCGVKFITTNYDDLLFQALRGATGAAEPVKDLKVETAARDVTTVEKSTIETLQFFGDPSTFDRTKLQRNKVIFHLHGSVNDEATIVSSTADYLSLYAKDSVRSFLSWFFEHNVVVFIGYGLEELELLDLIIRSGSQNGDEKPKSFYLLLPFLSHEAEILDQLQIYYRQLGITICPFSRDKRDYKAYGDLLERWSGELSLIVQEPMRVDSLELMDRLMTEVEGPTV